MSKLEKEIIIKTEIFVVLYAFFRNPSETQVQYFTFFTIQSHQVPFYALAVFRFQFGGGTSIRKNLLVIT